MNYYNEQRRLETHSAWEAMQLLSDKLQDNTEMTATELRVLDKWSTAFEELLKTVMLDSNFGGTKRDNRKLIGFMMVSSRPRELAFSLMASILKDQSKDKTDEKGGRNSTAAAHAKNLGTAVLEQMRLSYLLAVPGEIASRIKETKEVWSAQTLRFVEGLVHDDDVLTRIDEMMDDDKAVLAMGHYLYKLLDKNDLIEVEKSGIKAASKLYIELPAHITDELHERTLATLINAYSRKPMVVKPKMFSAEGVGGWLTRPITGIGRDTWRRHGHEDKKNLKLPSRYAVEVDRIAGTSYRIRKSILDVATKVYDTGLLWKKGDGGFFTFDQMMLTPIKVKYDEAEGADNKLYFEQKQMRADDKKFNTTMRSVRQGICNALTLASDYAHYPNIYFPVSCDWRGRVYFRTPGLSPQGDTFNKAVIEFAEGKRLGKSGLDNLRKFAASVWTTEDINKAEFADQLQWAIDNEQLLISIANDPIKNLKLWSETDSPFEFLAACEEIRDAIATPNPEDYVSHLPVRIDAVCSGIQHLSAISRDENVAPSVCLTGKRRGTDFYTYIAAGATALLDEMTYEKWQTLINEGSIMESYDVTEFTKAIKKLGGFTRGCCKPIGMQYTYAVKPRTIGQRWLESRSHGKSWRDLLMNYWKDEEHKKRMVSRCGQFVAVCLFDAVARQAGKCVDVMTFYHRMAGMLADHNLPFTLTNKAGFTMTQRYLRLDSQTITSPMGNFRIKSRTDEVLKTKQLSGVAANATHCNDSCLVIMTGELFKDKAYTVIHDSVGTHACDVDELSTAVRQSMYEMYKGDELATIRDENDSIMYQAVDSRQLADLELPATGTFDIELMLESRYLFC